MYKNSATFGEMLIICITTLGVLFLVIAFAIFSTITNTF